jgi:TonB family protein
MSLQRPDVIWLAVLAFLILLLQGVVNDHVNKGRWRNAIFVGLALFAVVLLSQFQTITKPPVVAQQPPARSAVNPKPRRIEPPKLRVPPGIVRHVEHPAIARTAPPVVARPTIVYVQSPPVVHHAPGRPRQHPATKVPAVAADKATQLAALAGAKPESAPLPCLTSARILTAAAPVVPPEISPVVARTARATIRVQLDAQGEVKSASVLRSSGSAVLNQAAMDAAGKSSYEPARSACVAIESHLDVAETFGR